MEVPAEVTAWFESIELKVELQSHERDAALSLLGTKPFALLLGLLLAERQGYFVQLSVLDLSDTAQNRLASVIQGKIQGIDRVGQTLLDLYPPQEVPAREGGN